MSYFWKHTSSATMLIHHSNIISIYFFLKYWFVHLESVTMMLRQLSELLCFLKFFDIVEPISVLHCNFSVEIL